MKIWIALFLAAVGAALPLRSANEVRHVTKALPRCGAIRYAAAREIVSMVRSVHRQEVAHGTRCNCTQRCTDFGVSVIRGTLAARCRLLLY